MASVEMSKQMLDILECPVCLNTILPPIYQCPNGHNICANCKLTVNNNNWPTCTGELGEVRCLLLEKLLATMTLHCQYQSKGCEEIVLYDSKAEHEESCRFRPYNCRLPCDVKGDIPSLVTHVTNVHRWTLQSTCIIDTVFRFGVLNSIRLDQSSDPSMYEHMGDHFYLHIEELPRDNLYGVCLRFMGEDFDARSYRYSLEIGNDETRRRMIWMGVPKSIRETMEEIRESGELMIVHETVVPKFAMSKSTHRDLNIRVKGFIWKEDDVSWSSEVSL